jgi:hypothetical protein
LLDDSSLLLVALLLGLKRRGSWGDSIICSILTRRSNSGDGVRGLRVGREEPLELLVVVYPLIKVI